MTFPCAKSHVPHPPRDYNRFRVQNVMHKKMFPSVYLSSKDSEGLTATTLFSWSWPLCMGVLSAYLLLESASILSSQGGKQGIQDIGYFILHVHPTSPGSCDYHLFSAQFSRVKLKKGGNRKYQLKWNVRLSLDFSDVCFFFPICFLWFWFLLCLVITGAKLCVT